MSNLDNLAVIAAVIGGIYLVSNVKGFFSAPAATDAYKDTAIAPVISSIHKNPFLTALSGLDNLLGLAGVHV